jgi:hypothetical protein
MSLNRTSIGSGQTWICSAIPPEADGEFVARMEEVLETYARSYDPARPVGPPHGRATGAVIEGDPCADPRHGSTWQARRL